jgi:hypothetical protein
MSPSNGLTENVMHQAFEAGLPEWPSITGWGRKPPDFEKAEDLMRRIESIKGEIDKLLGKK